MSLSNKEPAPLSDSRTDVSNKLHEIVNKCLEKNLSKRYKNCNEVLANLKGYVRKTQSTSAESKKYIGKSVRKNKKFIFLAPLLLVLLFFLIYYFFIFNQNNKLDSIAVLPFQNNSQDQNLEFLSREIPANIINSLTRLPNLRVVPRTTAFRYANREPDLFMIGNELDVTTVLTGEVNVIGENLIIRTDLVNIKENSQIWGEGFERKFSELLDIEEEITKKISEVLPLHLTGKEKANLVIRYTENMEAYRTYMEGRFWWNKRSPEGLAQAELLFKKATEIDPDYALAYAGLAECYCMVAIHMAKPEPVIRQARLAAEKALSIDESLAEAHAALGWIKCVYDWDWLGSERSFKQAIQLNPHYATAYNWFAVLLSILNRHEEAIRYMTEARKFDPGSAIINRDLGIVYAWAGDFENARKQLQYTIDMEPDFSPAYFLMGVVHKYLKKYDLAIEYLKKVESMTGNFFDIAGSLGFAYAKLGQKEAALSELKKLEDLNRTQNVRAYELSLIHIGLENYDQAFDWLDIACKNREFGVLILLGCESDLWFENMKTDPRFEKILTRMDLKK